MTEEMRFDGKIQDIIEESVTAGDFAHRIRQSMLRV